MLVFQLLFLLLLLWAAARALRLRSAEFGTAVAASAAAAVATPLAQTWDFARPEVGIFLVDLGLFLVLAGLAVRTTAFWPIWASGFQLGTLAIHLAAAKYPHLVPAAYAEALVIWSFPVLLTIAAGLHWEARKLPASGLFRRA